MDDFGTGESSLNMLDTIPVDTLKIDKNFLREQKDWETTKQIIMKIVELARDLKKTVVCEGVENKAQVEFLNSINCDIAQGFFYSKPLLSWELSEFLKKNVRIEH
jgi:EAL domain-containing protein (putative c-di-GMP-specific phosphodiesterase class I)